LSKKDTPSRPGAPQSGTSSTLAPGMLPPVFLQVADHHLILR